MRATGFFVGLVLGALSLGGCGDPPTGDVGQRTSNALIRSVQLSQTTRLLHMQEVSFSAAGWDGTRDLETRQCPASAVSFDDCGSLDFVRLDAAGAATGTFVVRRWFWSSGGTFVSCEAKRSCNFVVNQSSEFEGSAAVALSFRNVGSVTQPNPTITITPNTDLYPGQTVKVTTRGFPQNQPNLYLYQCPKSSTAFYGECQELNAFRYYDDEGNLNMDAEVVYTIQPWTGPPFTCTEPGSCVLHALYDNGALSASGPISFAAMGPPRSGAVQAPAPVEVGADVTVTGSGWATHAPLEFRVCPADPAQAALCRSPRPTGADSQGSFSITGIAPHYFYFELNFSPWIDCTAQPGTCVVEIRDSRDPALTTVRAPVTFTHHALRGSASLDAASPLVPGSSVRLTGSGFSGSRYLRALVCKGAALESCTPLDFVGPGTALQSDLAGAFRAYPTFSVDRIDLDCLTASNPCSLVVGDPRSITGSGVRLPLVFDQAETIAVTSKYEPEFETLLQQGVSLSGFSAPELQLQGGGRTLWVLAAARAPTGAHLSRSGPYSHSTTYTRAEYVAWSEQAARFDYAVDEFQKTGALFWAWILAGMPPFPLPG